MRDLLRQRIIGLACGYEDANDAARLAGDPLHKLAVGRDPITGAPLASQPTLSRVHRDSVLARRVRTPRRKHSPETPRMNATVTGEGNEG